MDAIRGKPLDRAHFQTFRLSVLPQGCPTFVSSVSVSLAFPRVRQIYQLVCTAWHGRFVTSSFRCLGKVFPSLLHVLILTHSFLDVVDPRSPVHACLQTNPVSGKSYLLGRDGVDLGVTRKYNAVAYPQGFLAALRKGGP